MTAQRQTTCTSAVAGRPSGRPRHERLVRLVAQLEPGEGRCLLLFFGYAFVLLVAWYILRTLREPLLLAHSSAELKTYASATAALALLLLVPAYGAAFRRVNRDRLVRCVTGFFAATLGLLYLAGRSGLDIGFIYYVWAGVFGVSIVAQFWAHAADCFHVVAGRRVFPIIMTGATLGSIVGPSIFRALNGVLDSWDLMLVALALLVATLPLVHWTRTSVPGGSAGVADAAQPTAPNPLGGFSLILRDRYLLLLALLVLLLNCVNTMGEYLLTDVVVRHAEEQVARQPWVDKGRLIGDFYAGFFLAINVLTVVLQVFVVGRLFRWIGVTGALLLLPLVAVVGYGLVAFVPIFGLLRAVKIVENSGNYSVLNTARQALFLPLTADGKYQGKIATDTFFWRFGDLIPAGIVFVGLTWLDFGAQEFALVNIVLSLAWLGVAVQIAKRAPAAALDRRATASRLLGGARPFAPCLPKLAVAARASSWLAVAVGLGAIASSAPAEAGAEETASGTSPQLFDDDAPLEMELVFDAKALCRNPQRETCADLPAKLAYRDARGEERMVTVALRTRGRYRDDTVQCALPALFVFFTDDTRGTLFAGQTMLPLTTHCARTAAYEQYLLKEYLAYRVYNVLTSKSLRVRLVHMTYRDSAGRQPPLERYAFFTEHFDAFAKRHGVAVRAQQPFDPRSGDALEVATHDLFQYAIGNTDWSTVHGHNVLRVESGAGVVTPVPYDFDFSGLVDAEYATAAPQLGTRSVRQRVFRGMCRPDVDWSAVFAHFEARRDDVLRLASQVPSLEEDERADAADYLGAAFATFASPQRRDRDIAGACRRAAAR